MNRDSIDFSSRPVNELFCKMLFPTLAGMLSIVVLNVTDGAFVGHGVGSNGIAAVNIASPIFTLITGIGLMFGSGCSIVASIHLSKNNFKAACINVSQAFAASLIVSFIFSACILANLNGTAKLFGSSDLLVEDVSAYLKWIALFMPLNMLGLTGEFIIRLDGSPKFAMACTVVAAVMNIILDWVFIFPLGWGVEGAALATGISFACGGLGVILYFAHFSKTLHIYRLKHTWTSLKLTMRNLGYQIKTGFPSMLAETAISVSIIFGNIMFIRYLGESGVAAFSVACYCMPIAFMLANSISQASQPIMSFAYGSGDVSRLKNARNISIITALISGFLGFALLCFGAAPITEIFLEKTEPAFDLSVNGLPYYSILSVLVCINVVLIGYYQSIEQSAKAISFTLLRGFIFVFPCFILLPRILGTAGLWLAMPASELLTLIVMLCCLPVKSRLKAVGRK